PIEFRQKDACVVGSIDRSVFQRASQRRECIDDALFDPRRIRLLGGTGLLKIQGPKVEEPVTLDRTAECESGLGLAEFERLRSRTVRILGVRADGVVLD